MNKEKIRLYLDSYRTCPVCGSTLSIYKSRFGKKQITREVCSNCGRDRQDVVDTEVKL